MIKILNYLGYVRDDEGNLTSYRQFSVDRLGDSIGDVVWFGELDKKKVVEISNYCDNDDKKELINMFGDEFVTDLFSPYPKYE